MDDKIQPRDPADPATTPIELKSRRARKVSEAIGHSQDTIFWATTVFPFNLFPDTVIVDREKVTIVNRTFFRTAEIVSLRINDVLNVMADVGPFFGSVKIQTRFFDAASYSIKFLKRRDALKLNRILHGYVIANQKGIDCDGFTAEELATLLYEIGQGNPNRDT
jgi:hypothetical protein